MLFHPFSVGENRYDTIARRLVSTSRVVVELMHHLLGLGHGTSVSVPLKLFTGLVLSSPVGDDHHHHDVGDRLELMVHVPHRVGEHRLIERWVDPVLLARLTGVPERRSETVEMIDLELERTAVLVDGVERRPEQLHKPMK